MPHLLLKDLPRYECLLEAAKEFPDLDPSAAEAFLHLLRTSDEVFSVGDRNLANHNMSHGRFGVLMLLWRSTQPRAAKLLGAEGCAGGPRTPAELAEAAGVTRATMTGLIDTLERDGFVKRVPDPDDRRMMSVLLTPKGERFLQDFLPGHFKAIASLMATLGENERKMLVRLLSKIQEQATALNAARPAASAAVG
ncbi:MAG TPA: MarR family transcriptional regulator [Opitutaceae bacterium]|nr:MarR family transcriptional regulator [Opitutaceae bacterium]